MDVPFCHPPRKLLAIMFHLPVTTPPCATVVLLLLLLLLLMLPVRIDAFCPPGTLPHADASACSQLSEKERGEAGVTEDMIRVSVGYEDIADIQVHRDRYRDRDRERACETERVRTRVRVRVRVRVCTRVREERAR